MVGTCQALVTCQGEAQAAGRVGGSVRWPWRRVGEQTPAKVTCRHSESTGVDSTWVLFSGILSTKCWLCLKPWRRAVLQRSPCPLMMGNLSCHVHQLRVK